MVFSDYLNLFLFNSSHQLGLTIKALQNRGLMQSLAEPNLIAENGKEASFLAGGEYPYPVAQGVGGNLTVTIVFKEYGIRLNFTPTLLGGDLVNLKVRPEVSSLDFANAISYAGFKIPALSTRRAETEIELQDGQTFAIAGLMNNTVASSLQKIPGIGDIPILGYLFRSQSAQKQQTELVVMITPQILRRGSMGAATGLPAQQEPYLGPIKKPMMPPAPKMPGMQGQDNDAAATTATAPAAVQSSTAAQSPVAAPAAAPVDAKKLAAEKKAADRAAAQKAEEDRKAQEKAQKELKKQQEAEKKAAAERAALEAKQQKEDAKKAEAQRKADAKRAAEQQKLETQKAQAQLKIERAQLEAAKKQSASAKAPEVQKKPSEAEKKQVKELQEAQDRLKAAQAAYEAAVEKARKSGVQ
jgi:flagellar biosynthesis GTPase FlhF